MTPIVFSIFIFFLVIYETLTNMETCLINPWFFKSNNNTKSYPYTLEWIVGSPPAFHTFNEVPLIKDTVLMQIK